MDTMEKDMGRSLARELLFEEMYKPYLLGMEPQVASFTRTSDNADSGMEDECSSPISPAASEVNVTSDSESDSGTNNSLFRPTPLNPSQTSAFNKIEKLKTSSSSSLDHRNVSLVHQTSQGPYFQGVPVAPLAPWIPSDYLHRALPLHSPRIFPSLGMHSGLPVDTIPNTASDKDSLYTQVDPRIPFTNYFMNLTKIFQKESAVAQNSSNENANSKKSDEPENLKKEPITEVYPQNNKEVKTPDFELESTKNKQTCNTSSPKSSPFDSGYLPGYPMFSMAGYQGQFPSTNMEGLSALSAFPSNNPLLHLMGGMTSSATGIIHPAFLQMAGLGNKRMNPEKPPPIKKYKCDVCGKAFSRSNTLVTHKRIHTGDKPFKCEVCGRAFRQPGNLTRHRLTHTTVKPYVCPTCNKAFNRASNLHTHMRTHTNYRPFICPYCGKGFHQKIDMKIHCYTHTGERPHRCEECGKGFTLASTLNTHKRIHVNSVTMTTDTVSIDTA